MLRRRQSLTVSNSIHTRPKRFLCLSQSDTTLHDCPLAAAKKFIQIREAYGFVRNYTSTLNCSSAPLSALSHGRKNKSHFCRMEILALTHTEGSTQGAFLECTINIKIASRWLSEKLAAADGEIGLRASSKKSVCAWCLVCRFRFGAAHTYTHTHHYSVKSSRNAI